MRIRYLVISSLVLAACSGGDVGGSTDTSKTDTADVVGDDDDDDDDVTDTVETTARLSGTVVDASGAPIGGANIRFCRGAQCRYFTTESDGAYVFDDTAVAPQSFEVVPPEASGLVTTFAPLNFGSNEDRVVDVTVPELGAAVSLPASMTELTFGALQITMGADDLEAPLSVDEATEASATWVETALQLPVDGVSGTVVAMWYLMPFDHHSTEGMAVRFDLGSLGLTGPEYRVYLGSYAESAWTDEGTITDGGGGVYEGITIAELSTLVVVEE